MENPLSAQVLLLAATLLVGMALGLIYDLLRVLRQHCGTLACLLCDALFCLIFAAALFLVGMGPGQGTLRLYMPLLFFCGAGIWFLIFGAAGRRLFEQFFAEIYKILRFFFRPIKKAALSIKKLEKNFKNTFSIPKKWFTITTDNATSAVSGRAFSHRNLTEETANEAQTFQYNYENRDSGADRLRSHQPGEYQEPY